MYDPSFRKTVHITYCPVVIETGQNTQKRPSRKEFSEAKYLSKCDGVFKNSL